jgi:hypothetical protein
MSQAMEQPTRTPAALPMSFFRHWVHSREEDEGDIAVYRPQGFAFPPAFARDGFELRADGRFVQFDPGPADGLVRTPGHWELIAPRTIAVRFGQAERPGYAFAIFGLNDTGADAVLKIRRFGGQHTGPSDDEHLKAFTSLPPATTARRIDFERAEILVLESFPPQYVLSISGTKPYLNMAVDLVPVVYIRQPEFWEIEVVGRLRGIGLPALAPYTATLNLAGATGSEGVVVLGATRSKRLVVPGGTELDPADE